MCFFSVCLLASMYTSTQCEDGTGGGGTMLTLSCAGDRRLFIRSALFGRLDVNTTCPHSQSDSAPAQRCASSQALHVVQTLCDGQSVGREIPNRSRPVERGGGGRKGKLPRAARRLGTPPSVAQKYKVHRNASFWERFKHFLARRAPLCLLTLA